MKTLLAAVVVIGLAAVAGAVIVGTRVFDGTVVKEPYERGIAWDEERRRQAASGLQVRVVESSFITGENEIVLLVLDRNGNPFPEQELLVQVSRPASTTHDRAYRALRQDDGSFRASVDLPLRGRWDLVVVVEGGEGSLRFSGSVYAGEKEPGPNSSCDLDAGPCAAELEGSGMEVAFDVGPKPLRTMVPLEFTVATGGEVNGSGEDVFVDLTMPGMFMGENTVRLEPAGERLWKGRGVIVKCPSGGKIWRAVVSVPGRGNAAFTFEVDR